LTRRAARLAAASDGAGFSVTEAEPADDGEIRGLLRGSSFGGDVSLSLEREPDSSLAAAIEGDEHRALVARDRRSGALAGIANHSSREVFVNGAVDRVAYLGQLRIDPRFRRHRSLLGLLSAGFDRVRDLQSLPNAPRLHLASVVAENTAALRLLARSVPGWPSFAPADRLVSLAIPATQAGGRRVSDVECERASPDRIDEIVGCLARHNARFQFSPIWSRADLLSDARTRGLRVEDFIVARREGRLTGCIACWDQRAFKQVVVRGYSSRLARWRPLVNALSPLTGVPRLPDVGRPLQFAYLSHVAVDEHEDERVLIDLVKAAAGDAARRGLQYVVLGLSAAHPMMPAVRRAFKHRAYDSILHVAFWPEAAALATALDGRPSHPELAIL
jgi:hypothetical protein